ncbi:hypothetical protein G9A89_010546 [Geosiphon pyriformis]|nr:hypothetical protein G9A89_010546 [Geosiphon pyriformis]
MKVMVVMDPDIIEQILGKSILKCERWIDKERYRQSYNVAPTHFQPVVRGDRDTHGNVIHSMKWGLIPFWTKNRPDYTTILKSINVRDDSLIDGKPMFLSMKNRQRCIVITQGFYEWLKKDKDRIPYFIRRKDGGLLLLAGLYDSVNFQVDVSSVGDNEEPLYTYTIITTSSSPFLSFLHDRMPVIFDNGSEEMAKWLDPNTAWTPEFASLLKPYEGELECYPVSKAVGKVGNDSPEFIVPIMSKEPNTNIADFFNQLNAAKNKVPTSKPKVMKVSELQNSEESSIPSTDKYEILPTDGKELGMSLNKEVTKNEKSGAAGPIESSGEGILKKHERENDDLSRITKKMRTDLVEGSPVPPTKPSLSGEKPNLSPKKPSPATKKIRSNSKTPKSITKKGKSNLTPNNISSAKITDFFKKADG